ncbi:MAG TPA: MMPL family transporter [Vicinamibacterales bacterium]|nr:MMPL family transporter [Vicinamibacterales bacterium]
MSTALAALLYRRRRLLSALILLGAVVLAPRASITKIDNDLTAWFSRDDPIYREYERFQDEFGGTRTLIIAIVAPSRERLFSQEGFAFLEEATRAIERVRHVDRVASLATATVVDSAPGAEPDSTGAGGDVVLDVRRLIEDLDTKSPAEVGARALSDDLLRGDLVSDDGTVAALIVFFDERHVDEARAEILEEIRKIVTAALPADYKAYYNGSLEISETYNRITLENQTKFIPPMAVLTLGAIFLMFRSWRRTVLTAGAVMVSIIWTLGLYDLCGFTYNVLSSMIVPLVTVLAVADDVHIIQHYDEARRTGSPETAFTSTVSHLLAPLLGASGTTALGMLSLSTSSVVAVREFGFGSAIGVMVDFVISIVLVPTILGWMKPESSVPPQEAWFKKPMQAVAAFSTRRARLVLAVGLVTTIIAAIGVTRLRVDTNHINFFSPKHPLGESAGIIDTRLGGIYTFQILLEGPAESMRQPETLARMDRLEAELRALPFVKKVTGLADYVKRIHRDLGAPGGATAIPADAPLIAQELFVFSLADQGRVELERVAASDFSKAQITIKLASMSSDLVFEQINEAERRAARIFAGSDVRPTVTGSGRLFATLDHYLVVSQISSFATAFLTVFAMIFLIFRSWRFGILAIVPNLFPVLAIFGVMGWLGISLNVATIMLASVALGVVDDDTIHFISRFRRETARGRSVFEAIELATTHEGRAALTTAIINSLSFAVLALSEYRPTAWFGGLLALTMVVAFLAEVFILPATITMAPRLFGSRERLASRSATP